MRRNQKLTKVIAGLTVKVTTVEPGTVVILFDDQSSMKLKTTGPATIPPGVYDPRMGNLFVPDSCPLNCADVVKCVA